MSDAKTPLPSGLAPTSHTAAPDADPADPGLVDALVPLSFLVQGVLGEAAVEQGISLPQLRLLGVLRDRQPGMQELARHLGLDKSSMTGLVDRAERRGLVRRVPAPHDGRGVQVALTEEGRGLVARCADEVGRRVEALAAGLSAGQRRQLSRLASAVVADAISI